MTDFIDGIGRAISGLTDALAGALSGFVHTISAIVPGGFPVFVVLCAIAVLVGLATFRR
jgi:phage-related protein